MNANWETPPPRSGIAGALDKFVGPGATKAELALQFGIAALAGIAAPVYATLVTKSWSWVQYAACSLLALDIAGGVVTNATSSAKRWYHRAGRNFLHHFGFVSLHLFHLLIVSALYLEFNIVWIMVAGGYMLCSTLLILAVPLYLQRPVAVTAYSGAVLICSYVLTQPEGVEWFLPLFYLKLLVSHLLKEEPYRPQNVCAQRH